MEVICAALGHGADSAGDAGDAARRALVDLPTGPAVYDAWLALVALLGERGQTDVLHATVDPPLGAFLRRRLVALASLPEPNESVRDVMLVS